MKHPIVHILLGYCFLFCPTTTLAQHHLGYLGKVPLLVKTGLYRVDNLRDSMLHLLSGRLTVQTMPRNKAMDVEALMGSRHTIPHHASGQLRYRVLGSSEWKPFPNKGNTVLLDTVPAAGDTIVLQLGRNGQLLEQLWFVMPNNGPQLHKFRLKDNKDTADRRLVASAQPGRPTLSAIFDTLMNQYLEVPAGMMPELLCNLMASKDSCLEYRVVDTCNNQAGPWTAVTSFFVPMGLETGNHYQLQLRFAGAQYHSTYHLDMLPYWYQTPAAICLFGCTTVGLLFTGLSWQNRRQQWQRSDAEHRLKLASMQWQPHFVSNAVTGIMHTLREGMVQHAQYCLGEMAHFFRSTLQGSSQMLVPLQQELDQAKTYLHLVQWHIGFSYRITVAADVDTHEVEFPPLLLQPMVENAVKHGVQQMGSKGHITIEVGWHDQSLQVAVMDNGLAPVTTKHGKGMGKLLTEQRVNQLNRLLGQPYTVSHCIEHGAAGTKVCFEISNWRNKA